MSTANNDLRPVDHARGQLLAEVITPEFKPDSIAARVVSACVFLLLGGIVVYMCGRTFTNPSLQLIGGAIGVGGLLGMLVAASIGSKTMESSPSMRLFEQRVEFGEHRIGLDEIAQYEPTNTAYTAAFGAAKFFSVLSLKFTLSDGQVLTWTKLATAEDSPEVEQFEAFVRVLSTTLFELDSNEQQTGKPFCAEPIMR